MAKVRVYELAKELGVESKTVLSMLKDMGEFVRSASSTVEAPVERRLKEKLASEPPPAPKKTAKKAAAAKTADAVPAAPAPAPVEVAAEAPAVTAAAPPAAPAAQPPAPPPATPAPRPSVPRDPGQPHPPLGLVRRPVLHRGPVPGPPEDCQAPQLRGVLVPRGPEITPSPPRREWVSPARRVAVETALDLQDHAASRPTPLAPGGRPGVAGMPRPNPAMMPKQNAGQLGSTPGGPGTRGRGAPAGGRRAGAGAPGRGLGPVGRRRVGVEAAVDAVALRVRSAVPAARPDVDGSPRSSGVKSSTRWRRRRFGGVRVKQGDGPEGSARQGSVADRPGREDRRGRGIAGPGAVPSRRDGDRDPVGERRHAAGDRR